MISVLRTNKNLIKKRERGKGGEPITEQHAAATLVQPRMIAWCALELLSLDRMLPGVLIDGKHRFVTLYSDNSWEN